ncbi:MAG: hypothetical protein LBE21_10620 [Pseudomonadales bacterium]|nr:hypothetical protein [Pseudomonadales bacterium]
MKYIALLFTSFFISAMTSAQAADTAAADAVDGYPRRVSDEYSLRFQTRAFEDTYSRFTGTEASLECEMMVELSPAARDQSFGAICELYREGAATPIGVMLCDDTLLGKFTIRIGGFVVAEDDLIAFTEANCPAGG